ncbi:MAG TPA: hypothetical protein VFA21_10525 [Pyrinomonadaceae bacterium]|nr:hypothetical protein [Pyrinomonadaceae bacterium]
MATSNKERFEQIVLGCFGSVLSVVVLSVGALVMAWLTGQSAYLSGIPLYKAIPIGAGVFLALALALYLIGAAFVRYRQLKSGLSGRMLKDAPDSPSSALSTAACPDLWLHTIAGNQKNYINRYVRVLGCWIYAHDLRRELYVDFKFTILNASVYRIIIDDSIKGDIYLGLRLLSKPVKMMGDATKYCEYGRTQDFVVRQWLYREEIADILDTPDAEFRFNKLDITIKGDVSPETNANPQRLVTDDLSLSSKLLRELYRELEIEVQSATFTQYWNFTEYEEGRIKVIPTCEGLLINIHVRIVNPRSVEVLLSNFRLLVKIRDKDYAADAEAGAVLYEDRVIKGGEETLRGQKFSNLYPEINQPRAIEAGKDCDGWLQFILRGEPGNGTEGGLPATLEISDTSGGVSRSECHLSFGTSYIS